MNKYITWGELKEHLNGRMPDDTQIESIRLFGEHWPIVKGISVVQIEDGEPIQSYKTPEATHDPVEWHTTHPPQE